MKYLVTVFYNDYVADETLVFSWEMAQELAREARLAHREYEVRRYYSRTCIGLPIPM